MASCRRCDDKMCNDKMCNDKMCNDKMCNARGVMWVHVVACKILVTLWCHYMYISAIFFLCFTYFSDSSLRSEYIFVPFLWREVVSMDVS